MSKKKPNLLLALAAGVLGVICMPVAAGLVFPFSAPVSITLGLAMMSALVWMTYKASA